MVWVAPLKGYVRAMGGRQYLPLPSQVSSRVLCAVEYYSAQLPPRKDLLPRLIGCRQPDAGLASRATDRDPYTDLWRHHEILEVWVLRREV